MPETPEDILSFLSQFPTDLDSLLTSNLDIIQAELKSSLNLQVSQLQDQLVRKITDVKRVAFQLLEQKRINEEEL